MLPDGVFHWTATHPRWEGPVSAYAIDDGERLVLVDPIAVPEEVRALFDSREVVTVLTSAWHERDAATLGCPVWAPAPDRIRGSIRQLWLSRDSESLLQRASWQRVR